VTKIIFISNSIVPSQGTYLNVLLRGAYEISTWIVCSFILFYTMAIFFLQFPISIDLFILIPYGGCEILIASSFVEKMRISLKGMQTPFLITMGV